LLLDRVGSWKFHAFIFLGAVAIRFHRRQGFINNIHLLISIEVKILKLFMEVAIFVSYLLYKLLPSFFNLLFIYVESEQINLDGAWYIFVLYVSRFQLTYPRMAQNLSDASH